MAEVKYTVGGFGSSSNVYGESLIRDRYTTPFGLRRLGLWSELPYSRKAESMINPRVRSVRVSDGKAPVTTFAATLGPLLSPDGGAAAVPAEADVISKLAGKWRNTDLNLGMYMSPEGRESIEMVIGTMGKLSNAALHLKRGDFGGFCRNLNEMPRGSRRASARKFNQGDISGAFLAAHLGWSPLIKDIYTLTEGIDLKEKPVRISSSKAGTPLKWRVVNPARATDIDIGGKLRIKIMGDISRPPTFRSKFGLDNPFMIAWELVPLSFVADYFLPIGSVIDSMGFISTARFSRMWKKTFHDNYGSFVLPQGTVWSNGGVPYRTTNPVTVYRHRREYNRSNYSLNFASPLRSMSVSLPTSVMRLGTMAALLHQRLRAL